MLWLTVENARLPAVPGGVGECLRCAAGSQSLLGRNPQTAELGYLSWVQGQRLLKVKHCRCSKELVASERYSVAPGRSSVALR